MTRRQRTTAITLLFLLGVLSFYVGVRSGPGVGTVDDEGSRLLREKRYVEAVAKYEAVVASDPTNDFAWYQLASASRSAGNCERALTAYRRYVERAPARNEPYYGMGICQQKLGDRAGALASFRRFVANAKPPESKYVEHAKTLIADLETGRADAGSDGR
jgi:tetratricopeptide (TPR) repeat protein